MSYELYKQLRIIGNETQFQFTQNKDDTTFNENALKKI